MAKRPKKRFKNEGAFKNWLVENIFEPLTPTLSWLHVAGSVYTETGAADYRLCYYGVTIAVECKDLGKHVTVKQAEHCMKVLNSGGFALELDESNVMELVDLLVAIENADYTERTISRFKVEKFDYFNRVYTGYVGVPYSRRDELVCGTPRAV